MSRPCPPGLTAIFRAFLFRRTAASHVAAVLGGTSLGFAMAKGSWIPSVWFSGILIVYAAWLVFSILLSSLPEASAQDIVRCDGFTYLPYVLVPVFSYVPFRWATFHADTVGAALYAAALVVALKVVLFPRDLSKSWERMSAWANPWPWATAILALTYAVVLSRLSYEDFASFGVGDATSGYDLAHYDQAAWNTIHGRLLEFTFADGEGAFQMCRLGVHADIIHVVFSLFYLIDDSPVTLLLLQSLVLALATWPLYLFTRRVTRSSFLSFVACMSFLLHPGTQFGNLSEFHAVCAAPLCLFALFYLVEVKRWHAYWVAFILTLSCKETLALTTIGVGLWLWRRGERRVGVATCLLSALWFLVYVKAVIPYFTSWPESLYFRTFYKQAGGGLWPVLIRFFDKPLAQASLMSKAGKLYYLDSLLTYVGYLPLLAPVTLIIALPELLINLLSSWPYMHSLREHYNFVTVPTLLLVSIYAATGIKQRLAAARGGVKAANVPLAAGLLLAFLALSTSKAKELFPWAPSLNDLVSWQPPYHAIVAERMLGRIEPEASVAASRTLLCHLSHRRQLSMTPYVGEADYVVCDIANIGESEFPGEPSFNLLSSLKASNRYKLVADADGIFLWQRRPYVRPGAPRVSFDLKRPFSLLGCRETLSDPAVRTAIKALQDQQKTGVRLARVGDLASEGSRLRGQSLIVIDKTTFPSSPDSVRILKYWFETAVPKSSEGYLIRSKLLDGVPCLIDMSRSRLGVAYGLHHIVNEVTEGAARYRQAWETARAPAMKLRLVSTTWAEDAYFDDPETALRYGFNAVMLPQWPTLVTYSGFDHRIYGGKSHASELAWVRAQQASARALIRRAKRLHLKVVTKGDVFSFPKGVFDLYGSGLHHSGATRASDHTVCAGRSLPWQLLKVAFDELFKEFPEIDYVMVRTGENYPMGPLTGSAPAYGACRLCKHLSYIGSLRKTINYVRGQVVDVHHREYIQRAWDIGTAGFHANPRVYDAILAGLDARRGLLISLKHSETDFWRYNRLNLNWGRGGVRQIMEFQCAREYEGKGAFPNYLGDLIARGAPETRPQRGLLYATSIGIYGGWAWAKGGGQGGPVVKTRLWNDANVHAVGRLMWDPFLTPTELAQGWSTRTFGSRAAATVADILLKSQDAVIRSHYFGPFSERSSPWTPSLNWTRDDVIRGMSLLTSIYLRCSTETDFNRVIEDQTTAADMAHDFAARFREVMPYIEDRTLAEQAYETLLYEQALYRARKNYVCGTFYYLKWKQSHGKDEMARFRALHYLDSWKRDWERFTTRIPELPWAASVYRSVGMEEDCEAARKLLRHPPPGGVELRTRPAP